MTKHVQHQGESLLENYLSGARKDQEIHEAGELWKSHEREQIQAT